MPRSKIRQLCCSAMPPPTRHRTETKKSEADQAEGRGFGNRKEREASGREAMTVPWGRLRLDVVDDEIIVSLPGTNYSVTYFKRANSPQLLAKNIPNRDDLQTPIALSDFLSRAWRVANDKARELGWIV